MPEILPMPDKSLGTILAFYSVTLYLEDKDMPTLLAFKAPAEIQQ